MSLRRRAGPNRRLSLKSGLEAGVDVLRRSPDLCQDTEKMYGGGVMKAGRDCLHHAGGEVIMPVPVPQPGREMEMKGEVISAGPDPICGRSHGMAVVSIMQAGLPCQPGDGGSAPLRHRRGRT